MCGICGFLANNLDKDKRRDLLRGMSALISHRGPDDNGYFENNNISLAHRRLSIIDKVGGHQPMTTDDENVVVVFNGEIYNFRELRKEFSAKGYAFKTDSDTEVILAGYILFGDSIFEKLNGMFAISIWDKSNNRLTLARDRLGIKPLYYSTQQDAIYFASEIKSVQYATSLQKLDELSLESYMSYGYVPGNETLISGITCLTPGSILTVKDGKFTKRQFWSHQYNQTIICSENEYLEQLKVKLGLAVKRRMLSDVPIGAFLSGGVDSSLIVALMAKNNSAPVKTFSIGFDEEGGNEFNYSRMVAKQFQTDHMEVLYTEDEFFDLFSDAIWYQDEPLRHDASVPLLYLAREAKQKATVILSGEGADELFLGYTKFSRASQMSPIMRFLPKYFSNYFINRNLQSLPKRICMLPLAVGVNLPTNSSILTDFNKSEAPTWVEKIADVDCRNYLISLLMKQDKMTMAAAIESRVPFLDHELVEWAHNLPLSYKYGNKTGKYLVKKMAADFFPKDFIHRQKMGFPVPIDRWMSQGRLRNMMREVFSSESFRQRGYFDADMVLKQFDAFPSLPNRRFFHTRSYQRILLWRIFNFEIWARLFLDADFERVIGATDSSAVLRPPSSVI
jgi:asparagine synthase (glutamine-hydrolysing)